MPSYLTRQAIEALMAERDQIKERLCCATEQGHELHSGGHSPERLYEMNAGHETDAYWSARLAAVCLQLNHAKEAPVATDFSKVKLGVKVTLEHLEPNEDKGTFEAVIDGEDAPSAFVAFGLSTITCSSPLGRALIGKEIDDEVEVVVPHKHHHIYRIVAIGELPKEEELGLLALDAANAA